MKFSASAGEKRPLEDFESLQRRKEGGSFRDYLFDRRLAEHRDIHCGEGLQLADVDDNGELTGTFTPVRYEVEWRAEKDPRRLGMSTPVAMMHIVVGNHGFKAPIENFHRFAWPVRR